MRRVVVQLNKVHKLADKNIALSLHVERRTIECKPSNNNNNNNNIYLLQLGCYPVAVVVLHVQGIHKRMVRFQKVTRNLFITLHEHNVHRQQRQLSKFLIRYQQFASHA